MKIIIFSFAFFILITKINTLKLAIYQVSDIVNNPEVNFITNNNSIHSSENDIVNNKNNLLKGILLIIFKI